MKKKSISQSHNTMKNKTNRRSQELKLPVIVNLENESSSSSTNDIKEIEVR